MTDTARVDQIQNEIVQKIIESGSEDKIACSFQASVGFGKSWVFYKLLYALLDKEYLKLGDTVYYWSETTIRPMNMQKEADKFKAATGKDPLTDFNIQWVTYQGGKQGERVLDAYDEWDFSLSAKYHKVIKESPAKYKVGFSGTLQAESVVFSDLWSDTITGMGIIKQRKEDTEAGRITSMINKGQLAEVLLPNVYTYSMEQAIEDGLIVSYKTILVQHNLDDRNFVIKKFKTKSSTTTEAGYYKSRQILKCDQRQMVPVRKRAGLDQANLLINLPSKVEVVKKLLEKLPGKTIVFGVNTASLYMVTKNVVTNAEGTFVVQTAGGQYIFFTSKKLKSGIMKYTARNLHTLEEIKVSKATFDEAYATYLRDVFRPAEEIIKDFDEGKINVIASAMKIGRGITLEGVENAIFMSYNSKSTSFIQKLGRVLRRSPGKDFAKVFILNTLGTLEEHWLENVVRIRDSEGLVSSVLPLNIVRTIHSKSL